jgi:hypothetical protein
MAGFGHRHEKATLSSRAIKMSRAVAVIALMLILTAAWPARADIRQPDRSPLPAVDKLPVLKEEAGNPDPLRVQVAYQGLKPTELPRPRADDNPEVDPPLRFLDTYTVTMISAKGIGQEYYLLIECDDEGKEVRRVVGWVNTK